ncbi:transcriptional regulator [Streptomyces carminius]|uniref:Transcriptional regulator n=1 Tax=Streptomyces carminius TaxID=2665496 RepID=A0A2M8LR78_9ACTN|nr:DUF5753 domain-containing protein [Streptomyces carminius]PJE94467.1 transcriptional regulator [Streptomyces carminius]
MAEKSLTVSGEVPGEDVLRCVGRQVKILRRRARLERRELGERIGYSAAQVAAVEQGRRVPQPGFLTGADSALDTGGALAALTELVAHVRIGSAACGAPRQVAVRYEYAALTVPGPLRTPAYARAVLEATRPLLDERTVEERLAAHAARPLPAQLGCVIEESVLHRPCGGADVLCVQLAHLLAAGRSRQVEVQVLPTALAEHPSTDGAFALLEPAGARTTVARLGGRYTTRRATVRALQQRYAALRARALDPATSLSLIEDALKKT